MKTTMKNFALVVLAVIALASCQESDPKPAIFGLTKIQVEEGEYAIIYNADSSVSKVEYTEGVDLITYSFNWSADKHKLTMTLEEGTNDVVTNVFEYIDINVAGKTQTVLAKVTYDDEGDDEGKTIQINYNGNVIESMSYNFGMASETGDASWQETDNSIQLNFTTNSETVKVNFNNNISAWWTRVAPEIAAVMFENEFSYAYFLSTEEVTSIENTYTSGKETPDLNDGFAYDYQDGRITAVSMHDQVVRFIWEQK